MQIDRRVGRYLAIAAVVTVASAALFVGLSPQAAGIDLAENLPVDPHVAGTYTFDPVEMIESWMAQFGMLAGTSTGNLDEFYIEMDEKFGMSFRDDVLAPLGPSFGFALTLPPYDQLTAKGTGMPNLGSPKSLEGLVVAIGFRDRERAVRALGALVEFAAGTMQITEDRLLIRFGGSGDDSLLFHGRISGDRIVLAGSAELSASALAGFSSSQTLEDGADFSLVSSHVDSSHESMTYMNLPKIRTWLEEGNATETMGAEMSAFMTDAWMGTGAIHASTRIAGGIRTTRFGPEALNGMSSPFSGGAMMVPMVLRVIGEISRSTTNAQAQEPGGAP